MAPFINSNHPLQLFHSLNHCSFIWSIPVQFQLIRWLTFNFTNPGLVRTEDSLTLIHLSICLMLIHAFNSSKVVPVPFIHSLNSLIYLNIRSISSSSHFQFHYILNTNLPPSLICSFFHFLGTVFPITLISAPGTFETEIKHWYF